MNAPQNQMPPPRESAGLAIASLVLGLLSIPLSLLLIGGLVGIAGIVTGSLHLKSRTTRRAMAGWGTALAVAGLGLSIAAGYGYVRAVKFIRGAIQEEMSEQGPGIEAWKGVPAPDFTVTTLDGRSVSLADFKGKRVVVDFWATWCPPCVKEIPHFVQLAGETSRDELVLLGISSEDTAKLEKFVADKGVNYPIASAEIDAPPYNEIRGIPTTFFIDRNGIIQDVFVGYRDMATLKAAALAADYEGAPNPPPTAEPEVPEPVEEEMEPGGPSTSA
jgi:peroxiredoxin